MTHTTVVLFGFIFVELAAYIIKNEYFKERMHGLSKTPKKGSSSNKNAKKQNVGAYVLLYYHFIFYNTYVSARLFFLLFEFKNCGEIFYILNI